MTKQATKEPKTESKKSEGWPGKESSLGQLYQQKGQITTQIEILRNQLQEVNNLIIKALNEANAKVNGQKK